MTSPGRRLFSKAEQARESAVALLALGDAEGAADRIYYALFHAARALLAAVVPDDHARLKTHASIIAAFGLVGIRGLGLPPEAGRLLNFAEEIRRKADYDNAVFSDRAVIEEILAGADDFFARVLAVLDDQEGTTP